MLRELLAPFLLLVACRAPTLPPPVADGRCLVARWIGPLATDQACQLGGYSWHCLADPAKSGADQVCDRGPGVGEAPARTVAATAATP